jgi:hypothetical protein
MRLGFEDPAAVLLERGIMQKHNGRVETSRPVGSRPVRGCSYISQCLSTRVSLSRTEVCGKTP